MAVEEQEYWRDIDGYEGLYQISNMGRVKSLPKSHPSVQGGSYVAKERILMPRQHTGGYLQVQLCIDGNQQNHYIHRLVATHFVPNDNPSVKTFVNHKNEQKDDNRAENLEWCTPEYNTNYGTANNKIRQSALNRDWQRIKAERKQRRLPNAEKAVCCISSDGNIVAEYSSLSAASAATGVSVSKISMCCHGHRPKAGGYGWQFK